MALQAAERADFFNNWLGLLAFANAKYNIVKDFGCPKSPVGLKTESINKIKTKIWGDISIIDEYIDSVWDLPKNDILILKGWKKRITGKFIIVRHLKKYTIFLDEPKNVLYGVIGITNPISEIVPAEALPVFASAVLLPFADRIIYDSLLGIDNIIIGPNMSRDFRELYSEIKMKKGIISVL